METLGPLPATKQGFRFTWPRARTILTAARWLLAGLVLLVTLVSPFDESMTGVPDAFIVGPSISKAINKGADYIVVQWEPVTRAINFTLLHSLLLPLERWLLGLPWWFATGLVVLGAYWVVGRFFALLAAGMMLALVSLGLFDLAMMTLAIVLTSTVVAVVLGVPTGIVVAKSNLVDAVVRPTLDLMQTMPSFVYLIPVLMLFGLGKVPAVIAVVIYAMPPIVRLTSLGIRQVEPGVIEAGRAFGATATQVLFKIQLPLAIPTIMAGLNQTIMMALAMVVIASLIGAKGLGIEVLNGIARMDTGRGLLGGVGIVIMAVLLDRITQGLAKKIRPAGTGA